jgi:hypothetical protein
MASLCRIVEQDRATHGEPFARASSLFRLILGGTLVLAILLPPALGPAATFVVANGAGLVTVAIGERLLPYRREWNRAHGDLGTDLLHAIVSGLGRRGSCGRWSASWGRGAGALSRARNDALADGMAVSRPARARP